MSLSIFISHSLVLFIPKCMTPLWVEIVHFYTIKLFKLTSFLIYAIVFNYLIHILFTVLSN